MAVAKSINQTVTRHIIIILVIVLTRADPALQYLSLLFVCCCLLFFLVGLLAYSVVIFPLCCYGIAAQYFGFSNFGYQNTATVQNVVLGSVWDLFCFCCLVSFWSFWFLTIKKKQNGTWVSFNIGML